MNVGSSLGWLISNYSPENQSMNMRGSLDTDSQEGTNFILKIRIISSRK